METWAFYKLASVSTAKVAHSKTEQETSVNQIWEWQGGVYCKEWWRAQVKGIPLSTIIKGDRCDVAWFLKWDWASLTFCNPHRVTALPGAPMPVANNRPASTMSLGCGDQWEKRGWVKDQWEKMLALLAAVHGIS